MNDDLPPASQPAPAGPPRTIRIGSFCENYVIWAALVYESCVAVRAPD
jgi:hypothetical protein